MTQLMRYISAMAFAGVVALGAGVATDSAKADPYRWCAQYGPSDDGGTNCYFATLEQCRAAISGNGGYCVPNNFYTGTTTAEDGPRRSRHRDSR
jgi:hypothetical protein